MAAAVEMVEPATEEPPAAASARGAISRESLAFYTCLVVVVVDRMGSKFTEPAMFAYSEHLGISLSSLSLILAAREVCNLLSNLWMPRAADLNGRKPTLLLSIFGSGVAYLVQGLAFYDADRGFAWLLSGKLIAGLFGGTLGLCVAYVLELSIPDLALAKRRTATTMACNMVVPMTLSPIGGAVARFGLNLPFLISAGVAAAGFAFAARFLEEVDAVAARKKDDGGGGGMGAPALAPGEAPPGPAAAPPRRNPYGDPVLLCIALAKVPMFVVVISIVLMRSVLIEKRSFGLHGDSEERTRENIAEAVGLIGIPAAVCMVASMTCGYLLLSRRAGDYVCALGGGFAAAAAWAAHGQCARLWHVAVLGSVFGLGMGLLVGCSMTLSNAYVVRNYPNQIATAKAVGANGKNVGSVLSAPLVVFLMERDLERAFAITGAGVALAAVGLAAAKVAMDRSAAAGAAAAAAGAVAEPAVLPLAREATGAVPYDAYLAGLHDDLDALLEKRNYQAPLSWNGGAQRWIRRVLDGAFPPIRPWTDDDKGAAYVEDLTALLGAAGEDRATRHIRSRHAKFLDDDTKTSLDDWIIASASAYASGYYEKAPPGRD